MQLRSFVLIKSLAVTVEMMASDLGICYTLRLFNNYDILLYVCV